MALQVKEFIGSTSDSQRWTWKIIATENNYIEGGVVSPNKVTITIDEYIGRPSWQSSSYIDGGSATFGFQAGSNTYSHQKSGIREYDVAANTWRLLDSYTFVVDDTGTVDNPTEITVKGTMSGANFNPNSANANGTMKLTPLHKPPEIGIATMEEFNSKLINLGVPDTTVVTNLSQKKILLNATAYDDATLEYRLESFNADYVLPLINDYQSSNDFRADYKRHPVIVNNVGKAKIIQRVRDSLGGTASDWLYVSINGEKQEPNGIPYTIPNIERTSTNIKRKSGVYSQILGRVANLTDNIVSLNIVASIYKANDIIGNNNTLTQIGYKIWADDGIETEPQDYTSLSSVATIDSSGNISVEDFEIANVLFTKVYNYKIIVKDDYNKEDLISDGKISTGQPTWTEYKDRVDFLKLTVKGYNPFEYSQNETICGEWLGKPLYRQVKVINGRIENGVVNVAHNISNVDTIFVNMGKTFIQNQDYRSYPLPINQYEGGSSYDQLGIKVDRTNVTFLVATSWGVDWKVYATLEYTKTTD